MRSSKKRKLPTHKPDSVHPALRRNGYHLSAMAVTGTPVSAYPGWRFAREGKDWNEPLSSTNPVHGISAPKVYPHSWLPGYAAGSYPAFSPFPLPLQSGFDKLSLTMQLLRGSHFLWHCLFPIQKSGAGYSPVGCPVLSGLSSPFARGDSGW